jgi:hypothetical protein
VVVGCDGSKCTRIEVHLLVPEGLQPVMDAPIYGRIACMELFRPPVRLFPAPSPLDRLLICPSSHRRRCVILNATELNNRRGPPSLLPRSPSAMAHPSPHSSEDSRAQTAALLDAGTG